MSSRGTPSATPVNNGTQLLTHWLMGQQPGIMEQSCGSSKMPGVISRSRFVTTNTLPLLDQHGTRPRPYTPLLTPLPSSLRPHCLARDHLRLWCPSQSCVARDHTGQTLPLSDDDLNRILTVIGHSLASGTREAYGSGLLVYHVFCDAREVAEEQRGPASSLLLLSFIATCAGMYSGKTLENYLYGVRAWHVLHGLEWLGGSEEIMSALEGASRLAPPHSKRPKQHPFTVAIILSLRSALDLTAPLDAAVYACLVTLFFTLTRLGELTVRSLSAFDPALHTTVSDVRFAENRHSLKVTVIRLPRSKMLLTGEDLYFAPQTGEVDPQRELEAHLRINAPTSQSALFSWRHQTGLRPLTRSEFLWHLDTASTTSGLEGLKGHRIRIGGTLEYLLRGVPFETVKSMGCWSGDVFLGYLRQHAVVMAPYLHDSPVLQSFTRYVLPPVR